MVARSGRSYGSIPPARLAETHTSAHVCVGVRLRASAGPRFQGAAGDLGRRDRRWERALHPHAAQR
eukprot:6045355-Prorocentrum_lima.AAC.1